MTIADTSVITAEVKVDESDIVNVQLGQPAEVTIDAIPKQKFKGTVTEIGNNARAALHRRLHRADNIEQPGGQGLQSGGDASESAGQPVARALGHRPHHDRDTKASVLAIPIQALTIRAARRTRNRREQGQDRVPSRPAAARSTPRIRRKSCRAFSFSEEQKGCRLRTSGYRYQPARPTSR